MATRPRSDVIELRRATATDVDDIATLLLSNEWRRGGTLTGHFDRATVTRALRDMPIVLGRRPDRLAGVLISSSIPAVAHVPVIVRMLNTYRGGPDAYVYGPICVDARDRGGGLAEALFVLLKAELPGREGILFIRRDNTPSIRLHERKLRMTRRGTFSLEAIDYLVLSYQG